MPLPLRPTSALNLQLEGTTGGFRVGAKNDDNTSFEVKYLLTHITLDYERGASSQILDHLAPVRELFPTETLSFDEIMQRDIDDSRVSSEMIPYLLDNNSRDLVKLFPPIVVMVLPTMPTESRPARLYPKVCIEDLPHPDGYRARWTRSGDVGQEVFEFCQPMVDENVNSHDLNRLKLNTTKTKLVIVDGQHRAMAMLAIHRNLFQDWSSLRRSPYADFYQEWTPAFIKQFRLSEISLPVMLCTVPELDEQYTGDYDLRKAARAIFLTLNKTARKVSDARNKLLDDNDLVALFLRNTLAVIKDRDHRSEYSLRIHNVELDQSHDRLKIESPVALTGVNHIYYIIEHLLLSEEKDINGAKPRQGKLFKRKDLSAYGAYRRLNGRDLLGNDAADATFRDYFSRDAGEKLGDEFAKRYGRFIVEYFVRFAPSEAHCSASLGLEQEIDLQSNRKLRPIIFEGQGMSQAFNTHRSLLKERKKEGLFGPEASKIDEVIQALDATSKQVSVAYDTFRLTRASKFLDEVSDKGKLKADDGSLSSGILSFITHLYENVFCTVAFQTAVICGFFGEIERARARSSDRAEAEIDLEKAFQEYLDDLHKLFVPKSTAQLRTLGEVFEGRVEGDVNEWKVVKTPHTFREVVYPGEMQPDQWPKYRYMILELWRPSHPALQAVVSAERDKCRGQVLTSLRSLKRDEYLKQQLKREEDLTAVEIASFSGQAYEDIKALLRNLNWTVADIPKKDQFLALASPGVGDAASDPRGETDEDVDSVGELGA
jgi:hypothetical protein